MPRLGIVPTLSPYSGGLYQYGLTVVSALSEGWATGAGRSVAVLGDLRELKEADPVLPPGWDRIALSPRWDPRRLRPTVRKLGLAEPLGWAVRQLSRGRVLWGSGGRARGWDRKHSLDVTLWTTARREIARFDGPLVVAFHDIQHRLHNRFPEFSAGARGAAIENQVRLAARRTTVAITESETGMEDLLGTYGDLLRPEQIRVLPYPPPPHITAENPSRQMATVRDIYGLPARYLFYPAQFWQHKNHAAIVSALGLLKARGSAKPPVVLSGSRRGRLRQLTFKAVMELAERLGVAEQLVILDYVPDEHMSGLYLGASALVMPTFCGPSNLPILEAWALDCPVITSDIRGVREQAGNAALLVDPEEPEQLAEAMQLLWTDSSACARLVAAGRERLRVFSAESFAERLSAALDDALLASPRHR